MGEALRRFAFTYNKKDLEAFIKAEHFVSSKLKASGHVILAHNYFVHNVGEIDIITFKEGVLYATEVKARNINDRFGGSKAQFAHEKQTKVIKTLNHFASYQNQNDIPQQLLAATVDWNDEQEIINCEIFNWDLY